METVVILLVLLVVGAILAFAFVSDFGIGELPTRCPGCKHDGLTRSRTPEVGDVKPMYECPHCGATYREWELR
jgi:hypothetical protein